jgi:thioredoxin-like negative regulator of GroEL
MAITAFEAILTAHPTSGRARLGLAMALADISRCQRALEILADLRDKGVWRAEAALTEGRCRLMSGDRSMASAAYEEAHRLRPELASTIAVAHIRAQEGRTEALAEALDTLLVLDGGLDALPAVEVTVAMRTGAADLDALLHQARSVGTGSGLAQIDARRWMDLDHPGEAAEILLDDLRSNLSNLQSACWRAEALRRMGRLADADSALSRPRIRHANGVPMGRSVRARMAVDSGDLDGARAIVADLPLDEEGLATRWYVARAEGNSDAMAGLETRWKAWAHAPDRRLEQLVPLHQRGAR